MRAATATLFILATTNTMARTLLSLRDDARQLPGSKSGQSSGGSSSQPASRNCVGSWSTWSSCVDSTSTRTFTVTTAKQGSGTSCTHPSGAQENAACGNCDGAWSCWSGCSTTKSTRSKLFSVTRAKTGAGTCEATDGQKAEEQCTPANHHIAWDYYSDKTQWEKSTLTAIKPTLVATELTVRHCDVGEKIEIRWEDATDKMKHDVWSLPNEAAYTSCDFTGAAQQLVPPGSTCGHTFSCTTPGVFYFACNVGAACTNGLQRVRVIVTDKSKVSTLKTQQPGLETLADVMAGDLVPVAYAAVGTEKALTDVRADSINTKLTAIIQHSPASCSDWLIPSLLDDDTCKAYVHTDLGYIARTRPTPDYAAALQHYNDALLLKANFCLALSYKTELYIAKGEKDNANTAFRLACDACGTNTLDMTDVRLSYGKKDWSVPTGTKCTAEVPTRKDTVELEEMEKKRKEEEEKKKLEKDNVGGGGGVAPSPSNGFGVDSDSSGGRHHSMVGVVAGLAVVVLLGR